MLEVFTVGRDGGSVGGTLRRGEVRRREVAGGEAAFRVLVRRVGRLLGDEAVVVLFVGAVAATASESAELAVRLKPRQRKAKNPFATQLHSGTLARLEWIKARGYVITDTVDDAINTYLDGAGIPRPDHNDRMP